MRTYLGNILILFISNYIKADIENSVSIHKELSSPPDRSSIKRGTYSELSVVEEVLILSYQFCKVGYRVKHIAIFPSLVLPAYH